MRIPIGFAGGLHDRDLGFVRFGWRDYDTFTGRWTAPDPMGDAGGDDDWYGYCLDDPVNGVDPLGLFVFLPFLAGMAGASAIAGIGAGAAGLAADGAAALAGKNREEPFKATKGAMKGVAGATATNAGIAAGAGAISVAPEIASATPSLIRSGKAIGDKLKDATRNPTVANTINSAGDFASGALPGGPPAPNMAGISGFAFGDTINTERTLEKTYKWLKK